MMMMTMTMTMMIFIMILVNHDKLFTMKNVKAPRPRRP